MEEKKSHVRVAGIDWGLYNVGVCILEVDSLTQSIVVKKWDNVDITNMVDGQVMDMDWSKGSTFTKYVYMFLEKWRSEFELCDRLVVEQQNGKFNPKMYAMAHMCEMYVWCKMQEKGPEVYFSHQHASNKFSVFGKFLVKDVIELCGLIGVKKAIPYRSMSRSQQYTFRKKKAVYLKNQLLEYLKEKYNVLYECDEWKYVSKSKEHNLADAFLVALTHVYKM